MHNYYQSRDDRLRQIKQSRAQNPEKIKKTRKKYRDAHKDKLQQYAKQHYNEHKDYYLVKWSKRRAKIFGNGGSHTDQEWRNLLHYYNHRCLACNRSEPDVLLTKDHIIPISKGGTDNISNIQPLCIDCNKSKFTQIIDYRS